MIAISIVRGFYEVDEVIRDIVSENKEMWAEDGHS